MAPKKDKEAKPEKVFGDAGIQTIRARISCPSADDLLTASEMVLKYLSESPNLIPLEDESLTVHSCTKVQIELDPKLSLITHLPVGHTLPLRSQPISIIKSQKVYKYVQYF
jgi:hypothetical protein